MDGTINEIRKTERLWQRIALIAGSFAVILCVMIIVNYFQINRDDPVSTKVMDQLVERLQQNPGDEALREQVRALDLVARKAYFTNQWQIRTGGYLLLISIAVIIIAMQVMMSNRKKEPLLSEQADEDFLLRQQKARRWISAGGVAVVVASLVLAFLSHQDLREKFHAAAEPPPEEAVIPGAGNMEEAADVVSDEETVQAADPAIDSTVVQTVVEEEVPPAVEAEGPAAVQVKDEPAPSRSTAVFANFRGPGGNGICPQKNIPVEWDGETGKNIRWKTAIPLTGFNSPIIWGDRLFLTGAKDNRREVYGIDRHTGEILWTTPVTDVPGSPAKPPEVANYTGHAAPTMATDGKLVFAIFANGDMAALDMDGKKVWSKNLGVPVNHYGYSSSLITHGDKVIVQYDQKNLARVIALFAATGEEAWSVKRDVKISWASPVIVNTGNRMELLTVADPLIISYNPDTGEEWWRIRGVIGEVGPSAAYADGIVFAVNDYSRLVAVRAGDTPEVVWEDEEYLSDIPSPVAGEGLLFVATSYGMYACYDALTGEKYWEQEAESSIYASPVIAEGKVYMTDKEGITQIFEVAREFVSIGTPALGEKVVCTPAFADGTIYIRGYDHVYCIGE